MGYAAENRDLTSQYKSYGRILSDYRPISATLYSPGMNCQLVAQDAQVYPDDGTIRPTVIAAAQQFRVIGVVSESWRGFAAQSPGLSYSFTSPSDATTPPKVRGTQGILCVVQGFHPGVLVDASAGASIGNGTILLPSTVTVGYAQGSAALAAVGMGQVGVAVLPSTLVLSTGALAQASGSVVLTNPPSNTLRLGDTLTLTITLPLGSGTLVYTSAPVPTNNYGAYMISFATQLNNDPSFTKFFSASGVSQTLTITLNANSNQIIVPTRLPTGQNADLPLSLSGLLGNVVTFGLTCTNRTAVVAVTQPTGGSGYRGTVPAFITGALC